MAWEVYDLVVVEQTAEEIWHARVRLVNEFKDEEIHTMRFKGSKPPADEDILAEARIAIAGREAENAKREVMDRAVQRTMDDVRVAFAEGATTEEEVVAKAVDTADEKLAAIAAEKEHQAAIDAERAKTAETKEIEPIDPKGGGGIEAEPAEELVTDIEVVDEGK